MYLLVNKNHLKKYKITLKKH